VTSGLDRGQFQTQAALTLGKSQLLPIKWEDGWATVQGQTI